ncbi:FSH1-domain-containing protein [Choiromyces venosus 120613-1]|uniref:FSH1-domain-containing protein n=1 Tax=Choiromyces venosus 120613-1 TaxID=1336337 RepID=A0A3N4JBH7_9PEZI|nr:FSH1-domain-containing protein [Choiromyces venosus 120613-1]
MSKPLKLLFLHGYTQSGPLFSAKTKALEKTLLKFLPPQSALYYPTAPHPLSLSDLPGNPVPDAPTPIENYAWWRRNETTGEYVGIDETWEFLTSYLDTNGPFDGVIGFSQGAALAAMLVSLLEQNPEREKDNKPESFTTAHPPLKFGVCYSGFRATENYDYFYEPKIETPVLHVLGSLDTVVDEERSLKLLRACVGGEERKVYHPGGHYLPAGKQYANMLLGYILEYTKAPGDEKKKEVGVEDMDVPF